MVGDVEKGTSTGTKKKAAQTMSAYDALLNYKIDLSTLSAQVCKCVYSYVHTHKYVGV